VAGGGKRGACLSYVLLQQSFPSSIHHSLELVSCTDSVFWPMRAESHKVFNIVLTKLLPHVASDKQIENAWRNEHRIHNSEWLISFLVHWFLELLKIEVVQFC
jgi:hypothetical protein